MLARRPKNIKGAMLVAGHEADENAQAQLKAARGLLEPGVPTILMHSNADEFSTPTLRPHFWVPLLRAKEGSSLNDSPVSMSIISLGLACYPLHLIGDPLYD